MKYKKKFGDNVFIVINGLLLALLTIAFLYPLWYVIMASVSDPNQLMVHQGLLLKPLGFSPIGYEKVIERKDLWIGYRNTLLYTTIGTALNVFFTCISAYVLSRPNFKLKRVLNLMVVISMYINAGMVPNFLVVKYLKLYNTPFAIVVPGLIATWNLIVLRTSFTQLPRELEEAAMIDGANDIKILYKVILPISKASIVVIALFYAVGHWNAWFDASIYLQNRDFWPLALNLREILLQNSIGALDGVGDAAGTGDIYQLDELIKYCSIVVSTLPILCVYPFAQKYFVKGVTIGSVKG